MVQTNYFSGFIGQERVKKSLTLYVDSYKKEKTIPHILFTGPRGTGKTALVERLAENLEKPLLTVNGGSLTNPTAFANQVLMELATRPMSLFLDEIHSADTKIFNLLLTLLNPNKTNSNSVTVGGINYTIDYTKTSVFLATTEKQLLCAPLVDRCVEISLDEYSLDELKEIIRLNINQTKVHEDTLLELARVCRGNPRSCFILSNQVNRFCRVYKKPLFGLKEKKSFTSIMGIHPLGLNHQEVNLLRMIAGYETGVRVTTLCSRQDLTRGALYGAESYLKRQGLVEVEEKTSLRLLSKSGKEYLRSLS